MARVFGVITFKKKGRSLQAGQPRTSRSAEIAVALAEQLANSNDGVLAFAQNLDVEADVYDDPEILFRFGTLPPELAD